jgi:hypothetical protein
MTSAATILVCVLDLLAASQRTAPVELLEKVPADVSANAEAFIRRGDSRVYLITSSAVFREAQRSPRPCGSREPLVKLASIITHELWHLTHGPDEEGAYEAQLMALIRLGRGPDTLVYQGVRRSMQSVMDARKAIRAANSRNALPY